MKMKFHSEDLLLSINGEFLSISSSQASNVMAKDINMYDHNMDDSRDKEDYDDDEDVEGKEENSQITYNIAIDDMSAFKAVEADLDAYFLSMDSEYRIRWLDGTNSLVDSADPGEFSDESNFHDNSIDVNSNIFNIENLKQDTNNMLNLPEYSFKSAVGFISPTTFFAPKNLLSLLKFLDIPLFSNYVQSEWIIDKQTVENIELYSLVNSLLLITQTYLHSKDSMYPNLYQRLQPTERINKLFQLKIYQCDNLYRNINIKLFTFERNSHVKTYHYYDKNINALYVDKNISKGDKHKLLISLIMSTVRIEVAVLEKNQCVDLMSGLDSLLKKMIAKDLSKVR